MKRSDPNLPELLINDAIFDAILNSFDDGVILYLNDVLIWYVERETE